MKCYIYKIINKVTNEKYVGQTTNFSRRISDHLYKLNNNIHPNPKLQASWNKYGENNFIIKKEKYDLTKEELNEKEIEEILKEDSFENGFNLTKGGDGGNTRGKLSFEDFCFAYFGNIKYKGMTNRTSKKLNVDSSTISAIARGESYLWYKNQADLLPQVEKDNWLKIFEESLQVEKNPPKIKPKNLTTEQIVDFLCVVSTYGRGAEAAMTRFLNRSKGLKNHIVKGEYKEEVASFLKLTDEEIEKRAIQIFSENNLQQYCKQRILRREKVNKSFIMNCAL